MTGIRKPYRPDAVAQHELAQLRRSHRELTAARSKDRKAARDRALSRAIIEHHEELSRPLIDASLLTWSEREEIRSRVKAQRWTKQDGRMKGQLI